MNGAGIAGEVPVQLLSSELSLKKEHFHAKYISSYGKNAHVG
jgi:hypothetical protein